MKLVRFLPLAVPVLVFLMLEFFYFRPQLIYAVVLVCPVLFILSLALITRRGGGSEKWWNFSILPSYFIIGLVVFSIMIPSRLIVQSLYACAFIFLFFYFHIVYNYLVKKENYKQYSLENISSYGNFLGIYFFSSSVYGLLSFLAVPVWASMIAILAVVGLAAYQVFWSNKINFGRRVFFVLIICLVLTQIAWTVFFLPLSFYISGLLFGVCYYMLVGLSRLYLLNKINGRVVKLYLIYGLSSIILVLLTARWM